MARYYARKFIDDENRPRWKAMVRFRGAPLSFNLKIDDSPWWRWETEADALAICKRHAAGDRRVLVDYEILFFLAPLSVVSMLPAILLAHSWPKLWAFFLSLL